MVVLLSDVTEWIDGENKKVKVSSKSNPHPRTAAQP